jgi:hypothetical protein
VTSSAEIVALWVAETKQGYLLKVDSPDEQADEAAQAFEGMVHSAVFVEPDE